MACLVKLKDNHDVLTIYYLSTVYMHIRVQRVRFFLQNEASQDVNDRQIKF